MPLFLLANPTGDSRAMYLARKVLAPVNLCPLEVYRALHVHLPSKFSRRVDGETSFAPSRLAGNRTKLPRGYRINNKAEEKVDRGYRADSQSLFDFREKFSGFEPRGKYRALLFSDVLRLSYFRAFQPIHRTPHDVSKDENRRAIARPSRLDDGDQSEREREREEIDAVVVSIARRSRVTLERSFIPRALLSAV